MPANAPGNNRRRPHEQWRARHPSFARLRSRIERASSHRFFVPRAPRAVGSGLLSGSGLDEGLYHVHDDADSHSLNLPAGSSATSRSLCVSVAEPTVRLFVKTPSTLGAALLVQATVRDSATGLSVTIPYVVVGGLRGGRWAPTAPILVTSALDLVGDAQLTVQLTPIGVKANWQVDDVYVDPFKSR